MPPFVKAAAAVFFSIALSSCGNNSTMDNEPALLFDDFNSMESLENIQKIIKNGNYEEKIFENTSTPASGKRPAFSIYTVEISNYKNNRFQGKIRLGFFNGKLFQATVFSNDPEMAAEINPSKPEFIQKNSRVKCAQVRPHVESCYYDSEPAPFFVITDKRIEARMTKWIMDWS